MNVAKNLPRNDEKTNLVALPIKLTDDSGAFSKTISVFGVLTPILIYVIKKKQCS